MVSASFWLKIVSCFVWMFTISFFAVPCLFIFYPRHEFLSRLIKIWSRGVLKIGGIQVKVSGPKIPTDRALILMANHQSGLDIMVFSKVTPPRATVIGKRELQWIPIVGWIMKFAGAILINRSDRASSIAQLRLATEMVLKHRLAVAYTPEGTRNPRGDGLLPFKKGGFQMAIQGQFPIVPVVCSRLTEVVNFRERRFGPSTLCLRVLEPIETVGLTIADLQPLILRVRSVMVKAYSELSK